MLYTNVLTITTESTESAVTALAIMKKRLGAGFECDSLYAHIPSKRMAADLVLNGCQIVLPENEGYYAPEEANSVFAELLKSIAATMNNEKILCEVYSGSDYSDSTFSALIENGKLQIEAIDYPYFYDEEETEPVVKIEEFSF
ncbi:MAG: hypothetical protein LUI12_07225 [Clostridiales bacterium]|nr:hypothetical protein [Clostridiales bacterium]